MRKKRWSSLNYLDLFAGAGFARIEGTTEVIAGSPIIAANVNPHFDVLICAEANKRKFEALDARIRRSKIPSRVVTRHGDANELINELTSAIPPKSLTVAFIDPFGLHFDFETMRAVAMTRCDAIVFFPDRLDALRNWRTYYLRDNNSNLDRFVGADWRPSLSGAPEQKHAEVLRDLYLSQLRSLGFEHFEFQRICDDAGRGLYLLIYASRSDVGARIWRNVSQIASDGQRNLFS